MSLPIPAHRAAAEINVTPLVDVCLVLLIIFMATSRTRFGFEASVPREEALPAPRPVDAPVVVSLKLNGDLLLNRERVEPGSLASKLKAVLARSSSRVIFFASDDGVSYETAIGIIDEMNRAGAKIGIATAL